MSGVVSLSVVVTAPESKTDAEMADLIENAARQTAERIRRYGLPKVDDNVCIHDFPAFCAAEFFRSE